MSTHQTVLRDEVVSLLALREGGLPSAKLVDCTLGGGGHAVALLDACPDAELLGIDRDRDAIARCVPLLARFGQRVDLQLGDHRDLARMIRKKNWQGRVGGLVADLGLSSFQLDDPRRGFSFRHDGPLDMRFDQAEDAPTAAELLVRLDERELAELFLRHGDEPRARRIAAAIAQRRLEAPVTTTRQLADLVEETCPRRPTDRIHPATRVFQALRIVVNREVVGLREFVADAVSSLCEGGRLAVISFHAGEDREIKNALRDMAGRCTCPPELPRCECGRVAQVELLFRRPLRPGADEVRRNPRARSACLRAAERVAAVA